MRDLATGRTRHASLDEKGRDIRSHLLVGDVSDDGRLVSYGDDNNAWVRDLDAGRSRRIWHEDNDPRQPWPAGTVGRPVLSGNGRYAAFSTLSDDVIRSDRGDDVVDIFRVRLSDGQTRQVTVARGGGNPDGDSFIPSLSRSGRFVGFSSYAGNLAPGETDGSDTFVRDMSTGRTYLASRGVDGVADSESGRTAVAISGNGRVLAYESYASNLVAGDTNQQNEVFVWKRAAQ